MCQKRNLLIARYVSFLGAKMINVVSDGIQQWLITFHLHQHPLRFSIFKAEIVTDVWINKDSASNFLSRCHCQRHHLDANNKS